MLSTVGQVTPLALLLCAAMAHGHAEEHDKEASAEPPQVLAPGYQSLEYEAPRPGSYRLPRLGRAGNGTVLDAGGRALELHDLLGGKVVLLSFIYTHCNDVNGCPLATFVASRVQNRLLDDDGSAHTKVRFISMSFDPVKDTPEVIGRYAKHFRKPGFDWEFLTTNSQEELSPILESFNQSIQRDIDADGNPVGTISHILRVFLIDREKNLRNIYSTSFLHPDTVINDIKTLLLEEDGSAEAVGNRQVTGLAGLRSRDEREGYAEKGYRSRSKSLASRKGRPRNLIKFVTGPTLGLSEVPVPEKNPLTREKIELGRQLFYDRRLSHNGTLSCAMCHIPEQGFTSNELATAVGFEGQTVRRNTPTLYNVAYMERFFHDSRETSLEQQVWGPLLAKNEMGNPSAVSVIEKIRALPVYQEKFEAAFDGAIASMETVSMALASYERTLISGNSAFDRWYYGKDTAAMPAAAIRGFGLFNGKANCTSCHLVNETQALFTDHKLHNTGIGYAQSMQRDGGTYPVLLAPGIYVDVDSSAVADAAEPVPGDLGYYEISGNPDDRWKFRTPTLRNVVLTAPYMHNGSLSTLAEVVEYYNDGGVENELLDGLIQPLNLSDSEIDDLIEFLRALTGDNIDAIVADAFAAPVGNAR